eukprot:6629370-Prorocentrum_lima.AAC.1
MSIRVIRPRAATEVPVLVRGYLLPIPGHSATRGARRSVLASVAPAGWREVPVLRPGCHHLATM